MTEQPKEPAILSDPLTQAWRRGELVRGHVMTPEPMTNTQSPAEREKLAADDVACWSVSEDGHWCPSCGELIAHPDTPSPAPEGLAEQLRERIHAAWCEDRHTDARTMEDALEVVEGRSQPADDRGLLSVEWPRGTRVTKTKGSSWTGKVVGFYSTDLTPEGYAVESENEPGSVQIYPRAALSRIDTELSKTI